MGLAQSLRLAMEKLQLQVRILANVYFMELLLKIKKNVEFEDGITFLSETCGNWECERFFDRRLIPRTGKDEYWKIFCKSYQQTASIERMHCNDWLSKCVVLYRFLVLPGSVETQLRWSGKHLRVTLFIPVSTGSKGVKIDQETPEL